MVTMMSLTKELNDLRQKAAGLEQKAGEEFNKLMLEINAVKVKIMELVGKEEVDAASK